MDLKDGLGRNLPSVYLFLILDLFISYWLSSSDEVTRTSSSDVLRERAARGRESRKRSRESRESTISNGETNGPQKNERKRKAYSGYYGYTLPNPLPFFC